MTFRRTSVPLRRSPSWRRSGDDSHWESLLSAGGEAPCRAPRPQSVSEQRGQMDDWFQELERIQRGPLRDPVPDHRDRKLPFDHPTASAPTLHNRGPPTRHHPTSPRQAGTPSFYSRENSPPSGTPSVCGSSLGGQETSLLHTGVSVVLAGPTERRGSWERVRIVQTPPTEQASVSSLASMRVGWLPIQRRVSGMGDARGQNQQADTSASSQVKMKQPITPIIQTAPSNGFRHQDGEAEKAEVRSCGLRFRTRHSPETSERTTSPFQQVSNKISITTKESGPLTWQSLRKGWGLNKISALSGGNRSNGLFSRSRGADAQTPPTTTPSEAWRQHTPLHRTSSAQLVRLPAFPAATGSVSRPSPGETSSATTTTLVPHNKASFSSITISSKKVTRTTGLAPGNNNDDDIKEVTSSGYPGQPPRRAAASPPPDMVTLQRKATIVKVMEQRVTSTSSPSATLTRGSSRDLVSPGDDGDGGLRGAVVHRRKATVIKVTEHRESYSPAVAHGNGQPHYRHSYAEGLYRENSVWRQGAQGPRGPSEHNTTASTLRYIEPPQRATRHRDPPGDRSDPVAAQAGDPERSEDRALHRSTLSLVLSNSPGGPEPDPAARPCPTRVGSGGRSGGSRPRPVSCYGNVFGHMEDACGAAETVPRLTRRLSCGLLHQETRSYPSNSSSGGGGGGGGGLLGSTGVPEPNADGKESVAPLQVAPRRPSLTLLKSPDVGSQRSAQEILALNAAAIIANIKLQGQLSKKKTQDGRPGTDASAFSPPPLGNEEGDGGKVEKSNPGKKQRVSPDHPTAPPSPRPSNRSISLQEALEQSRPTFIARSQNRVRELRRRAQERRRKLSADSGGSVAPPPWSSATPGQSSLNDNLFRRRDGAITGRDADPRSRRSPGVVPEGKRKMETKRDVCLTNRQRVELFKKRLLDQILQRNNH